MDVLAEDTIKLLDKLRLPAVHLIGSSIGGLVAEEIAIRHPKRVLSVTVAALDSNNEFAATATNSMAGVNSGDNDETEHVGEGFCPVDAKNAKHWAAARAAAAAAYCPQERPSCPVTLVIPQKVPPARVLQLPYAYRATQCQCADICMPRVVYLSQHKCHMLELWGR